MFSKGGGEVMAREFNVRFLGSVPIDPQFVMLVETGRRPVYPVGTKINGQDVTAQSGGDPAADVKNPELLVEKYKDCSLSSVFKNITKDVVDVVAWRISGPQSA